MASLHSVTSPLPQQARDLRKAGMKLSEIARKLDRSQSTVKTWIYVQPRPSVKDLAGKVERLVVKNIQNNYLERISHDLRNKLGAEISKQVAVLHKVKPTYDSLSTRDGVQGRAAVVKSIAETASLVFGWDQERPAHLVVVDSTNQLTSALPIIEAEQVQPGQCPPQAAPSAAMQQLTDSQADNARPIDQHEADAGLSELLGDPPR